MTGVNRQVLFQKYAGIFSFICECVCVRARLRACARVRLRFIFVCFHEAFGTIPQ